MTYEQRQQLADEAVERTIKLSKGFCTAELMQALALVAIAAVLNAKEIK